MRDDANFAATLADRASAHPDRIALVEPGGRGARTSGWRVTTFGELDRTAHAFAKGLARRGVRHGDRVLFLIRPSAEAFAIFFGLLRIGAIPVFIDPGMGVRRLLACVEHVRPRVVIAVPLLHAVRRVARRSFAATELAITAGSRWFWRGPRLQDCVGVPTPYASPPASPVDECFIPFTSGATGPAKGVSYTHGMLHAQAHLLQEACSWREGMTVVMGFAAFVPMSVANGMTTVLPDMDFARPAVARPERIVKAIGTHGAECAFASPIVWMRLVRHCGNRTRALPTMRHAVTAGAPAPIDLHRRLRCLLHPEGRLHTPYGATEGLPITTIETDALAGTWERARSGYGTCIGRAVTGVDVRVIRVTDDPLPQWSEDLRVPEGEIGELVVAGAVVSPGYKDLPEADARAKIEDGGRVLHRMGDLGRIDAEGRVWFCGRKSHRIETPGAMLAALPLENVFNEHPRVFRTAVVGVGPRGTERPVACVEMEAGERFSPQVVAELEALATGTEAEGVVRSFLPHRGFPVDARHNSKIDREALARWAGQRLA